MIEAAHSPSASARCVAVRDLSLTARDGCITGLLGPNGAGKSTTLRMLYTVLRPDSGDALIDGHSVVRTPLAAARRLGVLPHGAGIYPNLTARENILYFGALQGLDARRARAAAPRSCCELLGDGGVRRPACPRLLAGQRVKTALARALVHRPRTCCWMSPPTGST